MSQITYPEVFLTICRDFLANATHDTNTSIEYIFSNENILADFLKYPKMIEYLHGKILDKNNIDIIYYHGGCSDGFGSSFIIWNYFKNLQGKEFADSKNYFGCRFLDPKDSLTDEFLAKTIDKNIIMCDFSYRLDQLLKIIVLSKSFLIIDHHKTAQAAVRNIPDELKIFNMSKSGVGLTWDYFNPDHELPKFLAYIQDRDIWANKLQNTSEFVTYFYQQEMSFELFESYLSEDVVKLAVTKGTAWIEYQNILIDRILRKASYIIQMIDGQPRIVVYSNSPDLKSDIGNRLFTKIPFADFSVVYDYDIWNNHTTMSLRSTNERLDVSAIAKQFGGGGHRNASGLRYDGCKPVLDFERIDDNGLLELMLHGVEDNIVIGDENTPYILFNVAEVRDSWLSDPYIGLLKKKMAKYQYIIFKYPSIEVKINEDNSITKLLEYMMIYNEYAINNGISKLSYFAAATKSGHMTFTSEKEFRDIFNKPINSTDVDADSESESDPE